MLLNGFPGYLENQTKLKHSSVLSDLSTLYKYIKAHRDTVIYKPFNMSFTLFSSFMMIVSKWGYFIFPAGLQWSHMKNITIGHIYHHNQLQNLNAFFKGLYFPRKTVS